MESRDSADDVFLLDPTSDNEEEEEAGERRQPDLETFRNQWQSELNRRQQSSGQMSSDPGDQCNQSGLKGPNDSKRGLKGPSGSRSGLKGSNGSRRVSFAEDVKPGSGFSFIRPSPGRSSGAISTSGSPTLDFSTSGSPTLDFSTSSSSTSTSESSATSQASQLVPKEKKLGHLNTGPSMASAIEEEAKFWFEEGVILEQAGKLYEAVACYRKATQLVPDIEFKLYKKMAPKLASNPGTMDTANSLPDTNNGTDGFIELFTKLSINDQNQFIICSPDLVSDPDIVNSNPAPTLSTSGSTSVSLAGTPSSVHISSLPFEVMIHTLKYVVLSELDLWSLESIASTCRGFYIIARDEEIWKLVCIKIWGSIVVSNRSLLPKYDNRWRNMYINKPRVNYHGVYISKTTYIRQGESAFQDRASSEYRPVHVVDYFRYLRFFPNGVALMMTSPDEPVVCIPKLRDQLRSANNFLSNKSTQLAPSGSVSDPFDNDAIKHYLRDVDNISPFDNLSANRNQASVIQGVYQLIEPASVILVFKKVSFDSDATSSGGRINNRRPNRSQANMIRTEQIFNLELEIRSSKNRRHNQLIWKNYVVEYEKSTHGVRVTSNFDTIRQPNRYPPFWYSRVKSYNNNNFINGPLG